MRVCVCVRLLLSPVGGGYVFRRISCRRRSKSCASTSARRRTPRSGPSATPASDGVQASQRLHPSLSLSHTHTLSLIHTHLPVPAACSAAVLKEDLDRSKSVRSRVTLLQDSDSEDAPSLPRGANVRLSSVLPLPACPVLRSFLLYPLFRESLTGPVAVQSRSSTTDDAADA